MRKRPTTTTLLSLNPGIASWRNLLRVFLIGAVLLTVGGAEAFAASKKTVATKQGIVLYRTSSNWFGKLFYLRNDGNSGATVKVKVKNWTSSYEKTYRIAPNQKRSLRRARNVSIVSVKTESPPKPASRPSVSRSGVAGGSVGSAGTYVQVATSSGSASSPPDVNYGSSSRIPPARTVDSDQGVVLYWTKAAWYKKRYYLVNNGPTEATVAVTIQKYRSNKPKTFKLQPGQKKYVGYLRRATLDSVKVEAPVRKESEWPTDLAPDTITAPSTGDRSLASRSGTNDPLYDLPLDEWLKLVNSPEKHPSESDVSYPGDKTKIYWSQYKENISVGESEASFSGRSMGNATYGNGKFTELWIRNDGLAGATVTVKIRQNGWVQPSQMVYVRPKEEVKLKGRYSSDDRIFSIPRIVYDSKESEEKPNPKTPPVVNPGDDDYNSKRYYPNFKHGVVMQKLGSTFKLWNQNKGRVTVWLNFLNPYDGKEYRSKGYELDPNERIVVPESKNRKSPLIRTVYIHTRTIPDTGSKPSSPDQGDPGIGNQDENAWDTLYGLGL